MIKTIYINQDGETIAEEMLDNPPRKGDIITISGTKFQVLNAKTALSAFGPHVCRVDVAIDRTEGGRG